MSKFDNNFESTAKKMEKNQSHTDGQNIQNTTCRIDYKLHLDSF